MNALLVLLFALVFPLAHILNGWVFGWLAFSSHIGLIYLPAFLRLANVLILDGLNGTLATLLGGMLLIYYTQESTTVAFLNSLCSAGGPLVALLFFRWHRGRKVELTSLRDLTELTLAYAVSNAMLHHVMWSLLDPTKLQSPVQVLWMITGDILGALLGAYLMKWGVLYYRQRKLGADF
ncbi:MAG: hypothetical protein ACKOWC_13215 [Limnohabitans sp.]